MRGVLYAFYMATLSAYAYRLSSVQLLVAVSLCQRVSTKISEARIGTEPLEGPAMQDHINSVSCASTSVLMTASVVGCDAV
jgi:hypothetical protein